MHSSDTCYSSLVRVVAINSKRVCIHTYTVIVSQIVATHIYSDRIKRTVQNALVTVAGNKKRLVTQAQQHAEYVKALHRVAPTMMTNPPNTHDPTASISSPETCTGAGAICC